MRLYKISWNLIKFLSIIWHNTLISLMFAFTFDAFKSLPQNFILIWIGSKFWNFGLGNGESWKSQCHCYILTINGKDKVNKPGGGGDELYLWHHNYTQTSHEYHRHCGKLLWSLWLFTNKYSCDVTVCS